MAKSNFYYVFVGLLSLLLVEPFLEGLDGSDALIQLAFTAMMLIGAFSLSSDRRAFRAGLGLGLLGFVTAVGYWATGAPALQLVELVAVGCFCLVAIVVKMETVVLRPGPISSNRIVGALCIYLLIGVFWAILYCLVEFFHVGAFAVAGVETKKPLEHLLYFSYVTLTTVGYGDIIPVHPFAKTLTYLEAVVGQLFLAVLIAGLVGRRVASIGSGDGMRASPEPLTR